MFALSITVRASGFIPCPGVASESMTLVFLKRHTTSWLINFMTYDFPGLLRKSSYPS